MDLCLTTSFGLRRAWLLVACCSPSSCSSSIMSPRLGLLGPMIAAPCVLWRVKKEPLARHHRAFFSYQTAIFLLLLTDSLETPRRRAIECPVTTATPQVLSLMSIVPRAPACLFSAAPALVDLLRLSCTFPALVVSVLPIADFCYRFMTSHDGHSILDRGRTRLLTAFMSNLMFASLPALSLKLPILSHNSSDSHSHCSHWSNSPISFDALAPDYV